MRNEYLKTLWMLRFEKIKRSEEDAMWKYQKVLDECLQESKVPHDMIELLQLLVREERGHSRLADELIKICFQNHPECQVLEP